MRAYPGAVAVCLALLGCGSGHEAANPQAETGRTTGSDRVQETTIPNAGGQPEKRQPPTQAVRAYISALNAREGKRLCSLLAPGSWRGLRLGPRRSGCVRALTASIGQPGRHGEPRWLGSRLVAIGAVGRTSRIVRVTISLRHRLAGVTGEVPVEQDVVYLRPAGHHWLIAKPSAVLYRAVGIGDVPTRALAPPGS